MKEIGYIRVSSAGQNLDRQRKVMPKDVKLYEEKASGKSTDGRPVLKQCLDFLREDDHLYVASIDRMARSIVDLNKIVEELIAREVTVHFIKENLIFNKQESDALSKLSFNMLAAFAEFERALIKDRQADGIKAALARGVKFGAKPKLTPEQCNEIKTRVNNGEPKTTLAKEYGVGRQALYAAIKRADPALS